MDLSFPHSRSVNDGIDADVASLSYIKVEVAARGAQMGRGSLLAKFGGNVQNSPSPSGR